MPYLGRANAEGDPAKGKVHYDTICAACHGVAAVSTTAVPDLRYSPAIIDPNAFKAIVLDGERAAKAMVGFGSMLGAPEAEAIRAYLVQQAGLLEPQ